MSRSANHNANRISAGAEQLAGAVGDAVRELPDNLRTLNQDLTDRATRGLGVVSDAAGQALRQGRDSLERIEGEIETRVRSQPWHALLLAFGIGAVIALLARPRR
jgi:ElaB/YqjD/DUF883 family membrane-anchored ribosome-binding protein